MEYTYPKKKKKRERETEENIYNYKPDKLRRVLNYTIAYQKLDMSL
jgi:hypothetical protein